MVVDASVVVASLVESGSAAVWADSILTSGTLFAPHFMPVEAMNALRRGVLKGRLSENEAEGAVSNLLDLPVELFSFGPLAGRAWQLRSTLTAYDAWYVALAEALGVPFATVDLRLAQAPGPRCEFRTPAKAR